MTTQTRLRAIAATGAFGVAAALLPLPLLMAAPAAAAAQAVTITANGYVPLVQTLTVGDTVTYTNADTVVHQVEFKPSTGMTCTVTPFVVQPNTPQTCTFTVAGSYAFSDPNFNGSTYRGTLTVKAAATPSPAVLTSVTLTQSKDLVIYGSTMALSGKVNTSKAGIQVTLMAREYPDTAFFKASVTTTEPSGVFNFSVRPQIRTEYRVEAVDGTRKAESSTATVQVRPKAVLKLRYIRGGTAGLRTVVTSTRSFAGTSVMVQRRNSTGGWTTRKTVTLGTFSARSFKVRMPNGVSRWRIMLPAAKSGPGYLAGISPTVVVTR